MRHDCSETRDVKLDSTVVDDVNDLMVKCGTSSDGSSADTNTSPVTNQKKDVLTVCFLFTVFPD